eukprot:EG_transcript_1681
MPDNLPKGGVANFSLAACVFANVSAIYAQYAYQMQLQQMAVSSCAPTPLLMMEIPSAQPLAPCQPLPEAAYQEVPIQAAEDVLADCDDTLSLTPLLSSCCVCDVQLRLQHDVTAHLLSKEHQQRVFALEQRAVIVRGVPPEPEAAVAVIETLFQGFNLPPDSIAFIPAMVDPSSQEGLAKVLEQYRPLSEYWHVVFATPEDAQLAAQTPEFSFGNRRLRVQLAIQPEHCITCDVTLQSAPQLEDHRGTARHQEQFRQHAARCGLSLVGLPLTVTREELDALLDTCETIEGGYRTEVTTRKDGTQSLTVHLVFATEADADDAYDLCKAGDPLLGDNVRLLRPSGPKPDEAQAAKVAGEKAEEVRRFVRGLLRSHHIKELGAVFPSLFSRIYYTYISARPLILPILRPRNRFLSDFDAQCTRAGTLSLDAALALLRPLTEEAAAPLPDAISQWLWERVLRYCSNARTVPITRSTFCQIRDLMHYTHQVCSEVTRVVLTKPGRPGAPTPSAPTAPCNGHKRRAGPSWKPRGTGSARWGSQ